MKYLLGPPRQFIAANGVPTVHVLSGPTRGGEASYVANNIHFIANIAARLNYGKQTIANPRLVGLVSQFFDDAVRATLKNVASSIVGLQIGTSTADDIEVQGAYETNILQREELAGGALSFKRVPHDENALIAIFSELLGRGYLTGYHVYSLSQRSRYDGLAAMKLRNQDSVPIPTTDADLQNIEFKLRLRDLVADFEDQAKSPADISLVVVWDPNLPPEITDFEIVDIEHTQDADRALDGVNYCLHCKREARFIQLLALRDVIDRLSHSPTESAVGS